MGRTEGAADNKKVLLADRNGAVLCTATPGSARSRIRIATCGTEHWVGPAARCSTRQIALASPSACSAAWVGRRGGLVQAQPGAGFRARENAPNRGD